MSPPASPGETSRSGPARVAGSGWVSRRLRQLWAADREPAQQAHTPAETAMQGLTDERRRLVDRYTIDAKTTAARGSAAVAEPEIPRQEAPAVFVASWGTERVRAGTLTALLIFSSAAGLMLVSAADALSRSGHKHGGVLFWFGLLAIFLPVTARLTSSFPTRNERVGLLVLLGLASYLVKVFRDPFRFLYADEFVHQYNAVSIATTHSLFHENPILPATPSYPGLEAPTAALATMTGVSTFTAGLVVIAVARLIMMLALFLLYETVTGSARIAGLAAALYAASPHYLFFIADFSYESLALPIALLALVAVLRARSPVARGGPGWLIVSLLLIAGVVVTHHMTSYALIITLLGICLVPLPWLREQPRRPWTAAAVATALTAGWLVLVANKTVGYLSPVIVGALHETIRTFQGEAKARQLFGSSAGAGTGPAWEHFVAFASAAIVAVSVPLGARVLWRRFRDLPTAIVFAVAAVAYVGSLALRLVPAAWPIAARASEFLFVGAALVLALFALWMLERSPSTRVRAGLVVAAALLLIGDVISTTPSSTRLAQPYRVSVNGGAVEPQAVAVAQWASKQLGPGNRVAAQTADGRFLLVDGRQHIFIGSNPPIAQILKTKVLYPWQIADLRHARIRYVVTDSQPSGGDVANGYYFSREHRDRQLALAARKFQQAGAEPIYDSGDIVVYDLQAGLREGPQPNVHLRRG